MEETKWTQQITNYLFLKKSNNHSKLKRSRHRVEKAQFKSTKGILGFRVMYPVVELFEARAECPYTGKFQGVRGSGA